MKRFLKTVKSTFSNIKYTVGLLAGLAYLLYYSFLLDVNVAGKAAKLQLEDSDVAYAAGAGLATSPTAYNVIAIFAIAITFYCSYKLLKDGE